MSPLSVYVGYADKLRGNGGTFPSPWNGDPGIHFNGQDSASIDDGAIRLDNTSNAPITVDNVSVNFPYGDGFTFDGIGGPNGGGPDWGSFTIPAGESEILTATNGDNFDTSDVNQFKACNQYAGPDEYPPTVTVTIGGTPYTSTDSGHVLDTGGFDLACIGDESQAWRTIGGAGPQEQANTLTLDQTQTVEAGQPATLTAHLLDPNNVGIEGATVTFSSVGGGGGGFAPVQTGLPGTTVTDANGDATFQYTQASSGFTDTVEASTPGGNAQDITSNDVSVTWVPAPPVLDSPTGTIDTPSPTYNWETPSDSGITSLDLQVTQKGGEGCGVNQDGSYSSPLIDATGIDPGTASTSFKTALDDGAYCWHMRSESGGSPGSWSDSAIFTVESTPNVTIDSTNPATIGPNDSSTVTWHADQSGTYTVVLGADCATGTVIDGLGGSYSTPDSATTDVSGSALNYGDNTVWICLSNGSTTGSDSTSIKLLGIPTPLAPDNASTITGNVATIQWTNVGGETGYQLQYGTEGEGCDYGAPIDVPVAPNPSYTTPPLAPGHYCWHVQAVDANGVSGYDEDFEFYVAPSPPSLISPADGAVVKSAALSWSDESANGATSYGVEVVPGTGCDFTSAAPTIASGTTLTPDLADGTYCWRVQSKASGGDDGAYSSSRTFTLDTTAPTLDLPADITTEATGPAGAVVDYSAGATDNLDPSPSVSCAPPSGSNFFIRTTPVKCTATDWAGNTSTGSFKVTVRDTTPPTLTVPSGITTPASGPDGAAVSYSAKATDIVDPSPSVTCNPASGSTFPVGKTTVGCTAKDSSGNAASKSFDVTVTAQQTPSSPPQPPPPPIQPAPPPPPSPPPPPPAGDVNAQPAPGKTQAKVKLPGSNTFIPVDQATNLPPGTIVDVTGTAGLEMSDPKGNEMVFYGQNDGVPSLFVYTGIKGGVVQLSLVGGVSKFSRKPSALGASAKSKKPARRLWGSGKGKFTTKGKYASATVRGTIWLVADYSDHTLVTVKRGLVAVQNLATKKTTLVPAGHSVIVAKPKTKK